MLKPRHRKYIRQKIEETIAATSGSGCFLLRDAGHKIPNAQDGGLVGINNSPGILSPCQGLDRYGIAVGLSVKISDIQSA